MRGNISVTIMAQKQHIDFPPSTSDSGYGMTPWGRAYLEYEDRTIYRFEFLGEQKFPLKKEISADSKTQKLIHELLKELESPKGLWRFVLKPQGTPFQQSVWQALLKIPRGSLRTYQEIAQAIDQPRSVRAVANAIGANPICLLIPCHRVIRSDGSIGGYSSGDGASLKIRLLEAEGINLPNEDLSCESPSVF